MVKKIIFLLSIVMSNYANAQTFVFNRTNYIKNVKPSTGASNIVTNGLKINLDAGNVSSYSGAGTTWTDLTGSGNSMTISTNLANTFSNANGGSYLFGGNPNHTITNNAVVNVNSGTTQAISIELWVKQTNTNGYQFWVSMTGPTYRFGFSNGGNFFWNMGRHEDRNNTSYSLPTGVWKHAVLTGKLEGGSIKTRIYVDGVLVITQDEGFNTIPDLTDIFIGSGEYYNFYLMNGNLSICRVYNKALSSAEVLQNFNAEKSRFGL